MDEYSTRVWNRAAMDGGGSDPRMGDLMLSSMLLAHGLISSGGILHGLELLPAEAMTEAIEGYRYFGLDEVAAFLASVVKVPEGRRTDDDELLLDTQYGELIPTDSTLDEPFNRRLGQSPEDFAP
jgi:hypothetical protein